MNFRERALSALVAGLVEQEQDRARALCTGVPKTIEEYREQVGYLKALQWVRETCADIEKKLHGEDDRP